MEQKIIHKLDPLIDEFKKKTGISIHNFKPSFLERRILFRMRNLGISDYDEYVKLLSTSFDEAKSLYTVFSINVTKFFRDPHVWDKLEQDVLPAFLNKTRFSPFRAWSCGSASGEEPYSVSILLNDSLKGNKISYQVYATDISADAIAHAKKGLYQNENLVNVSTERLDTYFEKTPGGQYQVNSQIGKRIEYEKVDMMKTTGKLFDIVFCRNVLIYYDRNTHEQIFKKFADVLKKDGILVLGQDESMIGTKGHDFFDLLYAKERIYRKKSQ